MAQIADAIRTGELHRGDRLPSGRVLAARMEVSRPTLREALKVLAEAGVVEVRPGATGGTFVVSETVPPALVERTESRLAEIPAVLEARRAIEPVVAKLAARHATAEDIAALRRIVERQREAGDDWARITQLDNRFHREMARATKNPVIVSLMAGLGRQLEIARATRMRRPMRVEEAIQVNEETVDAIESGIDARIEAVMDRHLLLLEQAWEAPKRDRRAKDAAP